MTIHWCVAFDLVLSGVLCWSQISCGSADVGEWYCEELMASMDSNTQHPMNHSLSVFTPIITIFLLPSQYLAGKVKFSHTHYQALGPELIPVYRQSDRRWLFKSSPNSNLPLLSARPVVTAKECHCPPTSTKLYCLVGGIGTQVWTTCSRWLCSFVPVEIEPTTYWSQVQCLTATPLQHLI